MSKAALFIKQGFTTNPQKDDTDYPQALGSYMSKNTRFTRLLPYGLSAVEPTGCYVLFFGGHGHEALKLGMPSAMQMRKRRLKEGEVALYNSLTGSFVFLREDGILEIFVSGAHLEVNKTVIVKTGDVIVEQGNVNCLAGDLRASGKSFLNHTHGGVETGGNETGPPS